MTEVTASESAPFKNQGKFCTLRIGGNADDSAGRNKELMKGIKERNPLKRIAFPDDVSNMILFFASNKAAYITAEDFAVNGDTLAGYKL